VPFRVIPDRGQVSEYGVESSSKQSCDVFDDHILRSNLANESCEVTPKTGPRACNSSTLAGGADVLTGESAADKIDANFGKSKQVCVEFSDIGEAGDGRPVLSEHGAAVGFNLAEGNGSHPGALKSETESANS
jgi:hypothetical protein